MLARLVAEVRRLLNILDGPIASSEGDAETVKVSCPVPIKMSQFHAPLCACHALVALHYPHMMNPIRQASFHSFMALAGERALAAGKHIVLLVDGVDEMHAESNAHSMDWVPALAPPGVRLVMSCSPEGPCLMNMRTFVVRTLTHMLRYDVVRYGAWQSPRKRAIGTVLLPLLMCVSSVMTLCAVTRDAPPARYDVGLYPHDSRRVLIETRLMKYRKRLSEEQMDAFVANDGTQSPLFVITACDELRLQVRSCLCLCVFLCCELHALVKYDTCGECSHRAGSVCLCVVLAYRPSTV